MKNFLMCLQFFVLLTISSTICAQTISGKVYIDSNSNGVYDSEDRGIQGVKLNLYNSCNNGAMVATANSDNDGFYTFCVYT